MNWYCVFLLRVRQEIEIHSKSWGLKPLPDMLGQGIISSSGDVVSAFVWAEGLEGFSDGGPEVWLTLTQQTGPR